MLTIDSTETDIKILGEHGSRSDCFYILEENERHRTAPPSKRGVLYESSVAVASAGRGATRNAAKIAPFAGNTQSLCSIHRERRQNRCMQRREWRNVEVRDAGRKGLRPLRWRRP